MHYGHIVRKMIKDRAGRKEIYDALIQMGAAPCVARDWSHEPRRRASMKRRRERRAERKKESLFGQRGEYGRRIIARSEYGGYEIEYHATKGPRARPLREAF